MRNFLLLLAGALLIGLLSLICFANKLEPIKKYLIETTTQKLNENQIYGIDVDIVGKGYKTELATRLSGTVLSEEEKERAFEVANSVEAVFYVEDNIQVQKPKIIEKKIVFEPVKIKEPVITCQEELNRLLSASKINFESGKSDIKEDSYPLLKKIADIIKKCERSVKKIVIEGHTDSRGSEKSNLMLSQKRAEAVKRFLVDRYDIEATIFEAIGYGESQPIADNTTDEGMSKNRRIEFKLEGGE